jgi:hypothetical protein
MHSPNVGEHSLYVGEHYSKFGMLYPDGETPYEDDDGIREEWRRHGALHSVLAHSRWRRSDCGERRSQRDTTVSEGVRAPFERRDDPREDEHAHDEKGGRPAHDVPTPEKLTLESVAPFMARRTGEPTKERVAAAKNNQGGASGHSARFTVTALAQCDDEPEAIVHGITERHATRSRHVATVPEAT